MFPAFFSVPFVLEILSVQQILSRPRWKSKLIKKVVWDGIEGENMFRDLLLDNFEKVTFFKFIF